VKKRACNTDNDKEYLNSSGTLHSTDWEFVTNISRHPISPIFKGQTVPEEGWEYLSMQLYREWCGWWLVSIDQDARQ
jgi:hypothetical protein